jgi:Delta3-Delta2-enoyl-CoA isomerase
MAVTLTRSEAVSILDLGDDENRWSPDWMVAVHRALDEVVDGPATALVTAGTGKFFSNGLDLDWLQAHPDSWAAYVDQIHALLSRVLTLPVPTVAAVNGHAFGGGAMLAMAHDFRVMRADRGFLCFPEVDIRIPFTPGMAALIQAKVTPATAVASMTTGKRYGGPDALAVGLVDATGYEDGLRAEAAALVAPLAGKDQATLSTIKQTMFAGVVTALAAGIGG